MNITAIFTLEEKKSYLEKNGYKLVEYTEDYWEQWGNHDSQGDWQKRKYICAIKNDQTPSMHNDIMRVFEKEMINKFKQFMLQ